MDKSEMKTAIHQCKISLSRWTLDFRLEDYFLLIDKDDPYDIFISKLHQDDVNYHDVQPIDNMYARPSHMSAATILKVVKARKMYILKNVGWYYTYNFTRNKGIEYKQEYIDKMKNNLKILKPNQNG